MSISAPRRTSGSIKVDTKISARDSAAVAKILETLGSDDALVLKSIINQQLKQFTLQESTHVSAPQAAGLHTLGDEETSQHNLLGVPGDVVNQQDTHSVNQAASATGSAFEQGAVSVSGGNMGQVSGPRARVKKIKKRTPDTSMLIAHDAGAEKMLLQQEEARLKGIAEKLQKLIHAKKNAIEPKQSFTLRGYRFLRWVLSFGLSPEERDVRIPGHVRYNEIILTFLYWNKERNIVPQKMVEKRKKFDEVIQFEVAVQLIRAVCLGGIVRRRVMKIDQVKLLLQEVSLLAPAYLHLAAKKHGIAFGDHFQHLQNIPLDTLRDILEEPYVVSIIPAAVRRKSLLSAPEDQDNYASFDEDHLPSNAEENSRTKALDQEAAEVQILMQKELEKCFR